MNVLIRLKGCSAIYLFESSQSVLVQMFVCAIECSGYGDRQCKSPSNGVFLQGTFMKGLPLKEYLQRCVCG